MSIYFNNNYAESFTAINVDRYNRVTTLGVDILFKATENPDITRVTSLGADFLFKATLNTEITRVTNLGVDILYR